MRPIQRTHSLSSNLVAAAIATMLKHRLIGKAFQMNNKNFDIRTSELVLPECICHSL